MNFPVALPPPPSVPGRKNWLVAVSGGADSTALLCSLAGHPSLGPKRLVAAHLNYGLRGRSSDSDERFVRGLCGKLGVPLHVKRIRRRPPGTGASIQDWARRLRYAFFGRLVTGKRLAGVAVAHHRGDQAETVLDRILRGTGLRGLSALRALSRLPVEGRGLRIWRPLLGHSRGDLERALAEAGVPWRDDATNRRGLYRRNRIRLQLLPALERFNPHIEEALAHLADAAGAEDELLDRIARTALRASWKRRGDKYASVPWTRFALWPLALQRRAIRLMAEGLNPDARGLSFSRIEDIRRIWTDGANGPQDVGYGLSAFREGGASGLRS